jgi:hypothetical protein
MRTGKVDGRLWRRAAPRRAAPRRAAPRRAAFAVWDNLWFVPALYVPVALALSFVLVRWDESDPIDLIRSINSSSASAALSALGSGMLAFTGFVTSVILMVVQFGTGEFSPRFVAWFRRDATLFGALSDPGGNHGPRLARMAVMAAAGALLTALGFGIGGGAWGWVVLAAFVATLPGGLAVKYGAHRFVADVPHPSSLTDEGRRILFTFASVGIAVIVMFLAGLLQKRAAAKAAPRAPVHQGHAG